MDYDRELVSRDVSCPGDWVLMAALYRTEAGQLFAQGGKPLQTQVSRYPWTITVTQGGETVTESVEATQQAEPMPEGTEEALARDLSFRYDHAEATRMPSKQTATGWKGRIKDAEAAQDAQTPKTESFSFRRPSFRQDQPWGKVYGNAVHAVMQYIRYRACSTLEGVQRELIRLGEEGYLTQDQLKLVKPEQIYGFFQTEIGEKLLRGTDYVREFKFSILVDADRCGPGLQGEKVLLQGVVDCALLEPDGITVVDLKTDHVTRETLPKVVERYRQQVEIYADALGRIYENRIKGKYLYFAVMSSVGCLQS